MLKWIVNTKTVKAVLRKPGSCLIQEEQVEVHPENLPDVILDENVDVHLIKRYFSNDAWLVVKDVVSQKCSNPLYTCKICHHDLGESQSIVCDHCLSLLELQDLMFIIKCLQDPNNNMEIYKIC